MNQDEMIKRLKELGWNDVTQKEMRITDDKDFEDGLYMAFEHPTIGVRHCYSEQGVKNLLEHAEKFAKEQP